MFSKYLYILPTSSKYLSISQKMNLFFRSLHHNLEYLNLSWLGSLDKTEVESLLKCKFDLKTSFPEIDVLYKKEMPLMRFCQLYYFKFYLPMVLSKVDNASMYNSVEYRSPFLSKEIINITLNTPIKKNFKLFRNKNLLNISFKKDFDKAQKKRKKHGFAFPKDYLLRDQDFIQKIIDKKKLTNEKFFMDKYNDYLKENKDYSKYLWNELILNITRQNLENIY